MERTKNIVLPWVGVHTLESEVGNVEDKQIQAAKCIVDLAVEELMGKAPGNVSVSEVVNRIYEYIHGFGFGGEEAIIGSVNVVESTRTQSGQLEEVKPKEKIDVTATAGLFQSFLRDVPETLKQDRLNANVCSSVKDAQLDKPTVENGIKSVLEQLLKGNNNDVKYSSSFVGEMRNGNTTSAATLAGLLGRHNLNTDVGQRTDPIHQENGMPECRSLLLDPGDSNPQQFWDERYNNNSEYCSIECDDNSDNSNSKLSRELMRVADQRSLPPQAPNPQKTQDPSCGPRTLSVDRPGAMDGSLDDNLKMFMLHLDFSTLHENIDDVDSMTVSLEKPNAQRDSVCYSLKECNDMNDNDNCGSSVMEAPMSLSAYYNHGLVRAPLNTDDPPLPPMQQDLYKKYSDHECNYHMKKLSIKIQGLKQNIANFEESFEMARGYKPSQGEKAAQPHIKKYMSKLAKARKDLKRLKEDAENGNRTRHSSSGSSVDTRHPMAMTADCILQSLGEKRPPSERLDNIWPSVSLELQTVPEDEMMEIPTSFAKDSNQGTKYLNQDDGENLDFRLAQQDMTNRNMDCSDMHRKQGVQSWKVDASGDTHLHEMSLSELYREIEFSRAQKGSLRRTIREFENDFFIKTGRKVRKENRFPLQSEYTDYKKVKARLRLLEALILKHCE